MGPLATWHHHFALAKESGYNMLHLTPLNLLGDSGSVYSIQDQLQLNPAFFDAPLEAEAQYKAMYDTLSSAEKEYGLLAMTDVVWNHTSHTSPWLAAHPESTYNIHNSPHLLPHFQLDLVSFLFT